MSAVLAQPEVAVQREVLQRVFDRYHAAWEAKDPDAIVALHTEDSTFALRGGGDRVRGRAALRQRFAQVFLDFPGYRAEVDRLLLGDGHWVLEWTMVVDLPAVDGGAFTARIALVDVVDVDAAGLVTRKDVWVDGAQQAAAYRRAGRTP
ncbi:nuclear transport factor 2 family protein [Pseudonocardia lacus]|uniref:nuclear transport factor 2 family protein n=1 Tax=Pseudonocardia lacus TaxID=2835865 RepID=UPI001BDC2F07|nr:nuclear transport factor 2 family protein [Pseudonocardia lacus]